MKASDISFFGYLNQLRSFLASDTVHAFLQDHFGHRCFAHVGGANFLYRLFRFAFSLSEFSFALNLTILRIKPKGIGLSNGNLTVPFPPS
jgi:hypothetical protein